MAKPWILAFYLLPTVLSSGNAPWPTLSHDLRNSMSTDALGPHKAFSSTWQLGPSSQCTEFLLVASNNTAILLGPFGTAAITLDGAVLWNTTLYIDTYFTPIIFSPGGGLQNDVLYFGGSDQANQIVALNITDGSLLWRRLTKTDFTDMYRIDGLDALIVESMASNCVIEGLDSYTGATLWTSTIPSNGDSCLLLATGWIDEELVTTASLQLSPTMFIWTYNGIQPSPYFLLAYSRPDQTPQLVWNASLPHLFYVQISLDGTVYAFCGDSEPTGTIYALDYYTGAIRWSVHEDPVRMAAAYGFLVLLSRDSILTAYSPDDGTLLWSYNPPDDALAVGLAIDGDGVVYTATNSNITAIDSITGQPLFISSFIGGISPYNFDPIIGDGVFFGVLGELTHDCPVAFVAA